MLVLLLFLYCYINYTSNAHSLCFKTFFGEKRPQKYVSFACFCLTGDPRLRGLKQHTVIISQCPRARGPEWLSWQLHSQGCHRCVSQGRGLIWWLSWGRGDLPTHWSGFWQIPVPSRLPDKGPPFSADREPEVTITSSSLGLLDTAIFFDKASEGGRRPARRKLHFRDLIAKGRPLDAELACPLEGSHSKGKGVPQATCARAETTRDQTRAACQCT